MTSAPATTSWPPIGVWLTTLPQLGARDTTSTIVCCSPFALSAAIAAALVKLVRLGTSTCGPKLSGTRISMVVFGITEAPTLGAWSKTTPGALPGATTTFTSAWSPAAWRIAIACPVGFPTTKGTATRRGFDTLKATTAPGGNGVPGGCDCSNTFPIGLPGAKTSRGFAWSPAPSTAATAWAFVRPMSGGTIFWTTGGLATLNETVAPTGHGISNT